jgi:hypothetical protein
MRIPPLFHAVTAALLVACTPDDVPGVCGDGILGPDEACDVAADGCDADCHLTATPAWTVTRGDPDISIMTPIDVAVGPDGQIVVLGRSWGGTDDPDGEGWLVALDASGAERWQRTVPYPVREAFFPSRIGVGADGTICHQGPGLSCFDPDGDPLWDETLPLTRTVTALALAGDAVYSAAQGPREFGEDGSIPVDTSLRRHDPRTGELAWEQVLDAGGLGLVLGVTVAGDTLVAMGLAAGEAGEPSFGFTGVEAATGTPEPCEWGKPGAVDSALVGLPDGDLIVAGYADDGSTLRRIGPGGELRWSVPLSAAGETLVDLALGPDQTLAVARHRGADPTWHGFVRTLSIDGTPGWELEYSPEEPHGTLGATGVAFGPGFLIAVGSEDIASRTTTWIRRIGPAR